MTILYRIYQLFVAAPICLIATLLTAITVTIGCTLGNGHFWGYYPPRWWGKVMVRVLLLPVKVEGRENLEKGQSYVFVSNHQGAYDIFLIYGYLREGMSLVVFPEGSRSFTGHMGKFRRGAFMLADELQLPVVPLTINGSFNVKPRMRDIYWVFWHPLSLTIHPPVAPIGQGQENIQHVEQRSYEVIMSALTPEYQGFVENPDQ